MAHDHGGRILGTIITYCACIRGGVANRVIIEITCLYFTVSEYYSRVTLVLGRIKYKLDANIQKMITCFNQRLGVQSEIKWLLTLCYWILTTGCLPLNKQATIKSQNCWTVFEKCISLLILQANTPIDISTSINIFPVLNIQT
jgi:hypothetical protein